MSMKRQPHMDIYGKVSHGEIQVETTQRDVFETVSARDIFAIVIPEEFMEWHSLYSWKIILLDDIPLTEIDSKHFYETYGGER